jgi:group I intron endonuclease
MGCGIYKLTNTIDKKVYIGSSVDLKSREYKHFWMLKNKRHDNIHIQNVVNKFGLDVLKFEVVELCHENLLSEKENEYINLFKSNNPDFGYNLATVNNLRRNNFNDEVKQKLSKFNLNKNNNFTKFELTSLVTGVSKIFDSLVDAANYLIENGYSNGKAKHVRMKISNALRGKKVNNGHYGSIRKTCYKHIFKIIN